MGLRFDPMGGGQFKAALQQIREAERQPIKSLEKRKAQEEARMKLFGEFKAKFNGFDKTLQELSSFRSFRELKVDYGDGQNVISATLDKERAEPGIYTIEVSELAGPSSIMSNGFSSPDEKILGTGFVTFESADGTATEIHVDYDNASLKGLAALINRDPNCPVRASVVNDASSEGGASWKLVITSRGTEIGKRVKFPEFYFMDGDEDFYIDGEKEGQNAVLLVDGFEIEAESNDIKDFATGVNLHLKQARPDQPVSLTISEDYQKVAGKVKGLVDQINGILEFINKQNQVDESSDTRTGFAGDTTLQNIEYRIRNLIHEGFGVADKKNSSVRFIHLNQIGVQFQKNGTLAFAEDKFQKALESDFQGISEAISGEMGLANQLRQVISNYTRPLTGSLALKESAMKSKIKTIDSDIANKERRIEQRMQALTDQFSRLQGTLANMQKQQQYLSASLGGGGGGNMVQQLLGG